MAKLYCVLLIFTQAISLANAKEKLETKVLHLPADCKDKSENGQKLSMHYVGKLASDGNKFDSR